jgi:hypothetical protein
MHPSGSRSIRIEIDTTGPNFLPELFDAEEVKEGAHVTFDDGSMITYAEKQEMRSIDAGVVIVIVLSIPGAVVSTKKIVSWLMKRGPKPEHVDTVLVDRHIVEYNEGEIQRVIDELIQESHQTRAQDRPR